jgi:hypothetical protein
MMVETSVIVAQILASEHRLADPRVAKVTGAINRMQRGNNEPEFHLLSLIKSYPPRHRFSYDCTFEPICRVSNARFESENCPVRVCVTDLSAVAQRGVLGRSSYRQTKQIGLRHFS